MDLTKYIYINKNSLSEEVSSEIIDLYNSHAKKELNNELIFDISDNNNICKLIIKEMKKNFVNYTTYLRSNMSNVPFNFEKLYSEKIIIKKYSKNEIINEFKEELVVVDNNTSNEISKLIFVWYLNNVEEGGETEFWQGKYIVKPEVGKMVIFPSCWTFPHSGKIPLSCDKYILTGKLFFNLN